MKLSLALLVGGAAAFAPAPQQATRAAALSAYVPSGLTASEYAKIKADKAAKAQANKSRFPKGIAFLDMGAWIDKMEAAQTFDGDRYMKSGHTYAKVKYETKAEFDAARAAGKTGPAKGKTGPGFKNPFAK
mmetsp:Transcript_12706/g.37806  ORF Transcript_12706/g.37806 Transcript_12706/m.37806 type:complete len:131 (+) Transcript_12706:63-455(+)